MPGNDFLFVDNKSANSFIPDLSKPIPQGFSTSNGLEIPVDKEAILAPITEVEKTPLKPGKPDPTSKFEGVRRGIYPEGFDSWDPATQKKYIEGVSKQADLNLANTTFVSPTDQLYKYNTNAANLTRSLESYNSPIDITANEKYLRNEGYFLNSDISESYNEARIGTVNTLLRGLGGMAIRTVTSGLDGTIGLVNGLVEWGVNGDFTSFYDNDFSRTMEKWNADYNEGPGAIFFSQAQRESSALSPTNLISMNFIAEKLIKNAGFVFGMALSGKAWQGVFNLLTTANNLPKTAKILNEIEKHGLSQSAEKAFRASVTEIETIAKGTQSAKEIGGLIKEAATRMKNVAPTLTNEVDKFVTVASKQPNWFSKNFLGQGGINKLSGVFASVAEAGSESLGHATQMRDSMIDKYVETYGKLPEGEDYQNILKASQYSADRVFIKNLALLSVTNNFQLKSIVKSFKNTANEARVGINAVTLMEKEAAKAGTKAAVIAESNIAKSLKPNRVGLSADVAYEYGKRDRLKFLNKFGYTGKAIKFTARIANAIGRYTFSFPEMVEEGGQFIITNTEMDFVNKKYNPKAQQTFDAIKKGMSLSLTEMALIGIPRLVTTKEGGESLILGNLTGGLFQGVMGRKERVQKRKVTEIARKELNAETASDVLGAGLIQDWDVKKVAEKAEAELKDKEEAAVRDIALSEEERKAANKNDKNGFYNARNQRIMNFFLPRIKYGKMKDAKAELQGLKDLPLAQKLIALGLTDETLKREADADWTAEKAEADINKRIDDMLSLGDSLQKTYDAVKLKLGVANKKEVINGRNKYVSRYSEETLERIVFNMFSALDSEKRLKELYVKLDKFNRENLNGELPLAELFDKKLIGTLGSSTEDGTRMDIEELRDRALAKIANIPSTEDIAKDINDVIKLQNQKEEYVSAYKMLTADPITKLDLTKSFEDYTVDEYREFERQMTYGAYNQNLQINQALRENSNRLLSLLTPISERIDTSQESINEIQKEIDKIKAERDVLLKQKASINKNFEDQKASIAQEQRAITDNYTTQVSELEALIEDERKKETVDEGFIKDTQKEIEELNAQKDAELAPNITALAALDVEIAKENAAFSVNNTAVMIKLNQEIARQAPLVDAKRKISEEYAKVLLEHWTNIDASEEVRKLNEGGNGQEDTNNFKVAVFDRMRRAFIGLVIERNQNNDAFLESFGVTESDHNPKTGKEEFEFVPYDPDIETATSEELDEYYTKIKELIANNVVNTVGLEEAFNAIEEYKGKFTYAKFRNANDRRYDLVVSSPLGLGLKTARIIKTFITQDPNYDDIASVKEHIKFLEKIKSVFEKRKDLDKESDKKFFEPMIEEINNLLKLFEDNIGEIEARATSKEKIQDDIKEVDDKASPQLLGLDKEFNVLNKEYNDLLKVLVPDYDELLEKAKTEAIYYSIILEKAKIQAVTVDNTNNNDDFHNKLNTLTLEFAAQNTGTLIDGIEFLQELVQYKTTKDFFENVPSSPRTAAEISVFNLIANPLNAISSVKELLKPVLNLGTLLSDPKNPLAKFFNLHGSIDLLIEDLKKEPADTLYDLASTKFVTKVTTKDLIDFFEKISKASSALNANRYFNSIIQYFDEINSALNKIEATKKSLFTYQQRKAVKELLFNSDSIKLGNQEFIDLIISKFGNHQHYNNPKNNKYQTTGTSGSLIREFNNLVYFNGVIGSGKSKVVFEDYLFLLKELEILNETGVAISSDNVISVNNIISVAKNLGIENTNKKTLTVAEILAEAEKSSIYKVINSRLFIIDEIAKLSDPELIKLVKLVDAHNINNPNESIRIVGLGDVNQNQKAEIRQGIKIINGYNAILSSNPYVTYISPLTVSYRSSIPVIEQVQRYFNRVNNYTSGTEPLALESTVLPHDAGKMLGAAGGKDESHLIKTLQQRVKSEDKERVLVIDEDTHAEWKRKLDAAGLTTVLVSELPSTGEIPKGSLLIGTSEEVQSRTFQEVYIYLQVPKNTGAAGNTQIAVYNKAIYTAARATDFLYLGNMDVTNNINTNIEKVKKINESKNFDRIKSNKELLEDEKNAFVEKFKPKTSVGTTPPGNSPSGNNPPKTNPPKTNPPAGTSSGNTPGKNPVDDPDDPDNDPDDPLGNSQLGKTPEGAKKDVENKGKLNKLPDNTESGQEVRRVTGDVLKVGGLGKDVSVEPGRPVFLVPYQYQGNQLGFSIVTTDADGYLIEIGKYSKGQESSVIFYKGNTLTNLAEERANSTYITSPSTIRVEFNGKSNYLTNKNNKLKPEDVKHIIIAKGVIQEFETQKFSYSVPPGAIVQPTVISDVAARLGSGVKPEDLILKIFTYKQWSNLTDESKKFIVVGQAYLYHRESKVYVHVRNKTLANNISEKDSNHVNEAYINPINRFLSEIAAFNKNLGITRTDAIEDGEYLYKIEADYLDGLAPYIESSKLAGHYKLSFKLGGNVGSRVPFNYIVNLLSDFNLINRRDALEQHLKNKPLDAEATENLATIKFFINTFLVKKGTTEIDLVRYTTLARQAAILKTYTTEYKDDSKDEPRRIDWEQTFNNSKNNIDFNSAQLLALGGRKGFSTYYADIFNATQKEFSSNPELEKRLKEAAKSLGIEVTAFIYGQRHVVHYSDQIMKNGKPTYELIYHETELPGILQNALININNANPNLVIDGKILNLSTSIQTKGTDSVDYEDFLTNVVIKTRGVFDNSIHNVESIMSDKTQIYTRQIMLGLISNMKVLLRSHDVRKTIDTDIIRSYNLDKGTLNGIINPIIKSIVEKLTVLDFNGVKKDNKMTPAKYAELQKEIDELSPAEKKLVLAALNKSNNSFGEFELTSLLSNADKIKINISRTIGQAGRISGKIEPRFSYKFALDESTVGNMSSGGDIYSEKKKAFTEGEDTVTLRVPYVLNAHMESQGKGRRKYINTWDKIASELTNSAFTGRTPDRLVIAFEANSGASAPKKEPVVPTEPIVPTEPVSPVEPTEPIVPTEPVDITSTQSEIEVKEAEIIKRNKEALQLKSENNPNGYYVGKRIEEREGKKDFFIYYSHFYEHSTNEDDFENIEANTQEELFDKINAKYNAELKALEQQPASTTQSEINAKLAEIETVKNRILTLKEEDAKIDKNPQEVPDPGGKKMYFAGVDEDGSFPTRIVSDSFNPEVHTYVLQIDPSGTTASVIFNNNPATLRTALQAPHLYLTPLFKPLNAMASAKSVRVVEKGMWKLEGEKWVMVKQPTVFYVDSNSPIPNKNSYEIEVVLERKIRGLEKKLKALEQQLNTESEQNDNQSNNNNKDDLGELETKKVPENKPSEFIDPRTIATSNGVTLQELIDQEIFNLKNESEEEFKELIFDGEAIIGDSIKIEIKDLPKYESFTPRRKTTLHKRVYETNINWDQVILNMEQNNELTLKCK